MTTRDDLLDLFEKHADRIDGELLIPIGTAADLIADHTNLFGDRNDI